MAVGSKLNADGAGRDLVAADVALGAGWGTTPVLAITPGSNRSRGTLLITADATAAQATATVVITFPEPFDSVPHAVISRVAGTATVGDDFEITEVTAEELSVVKVEIPVDTETQAFSYLVVE